MLVTPGHLRLEEKLGREDPGAEVILSTTITNAQGIRAQEYRYWSAGIYPAEAEHLETSQSALQIYRAYESNVTLGHGPTAVAAAAQRTAKLLDTGPIQSPLFWLTGTVTGLGLTILTLAFSLSKRKRHELIFRRLTTAQHLLAGVVLSLDALELALALDDTRLNTAVMLGTAPKNMSAESDQRIFESALAMAWRLADDLQERPLSQRLDPGYVAEVAKLKQSVQTLVLRNTDVHRRTQSLLDAARGRNPKRNTSEIPKVTS